MTQKLFLFSIVPLLLLAACEQPSEAASPEMPVAAPAKAPYAPSAPLDDKARVTAANFEGDANLTDDVEPSFVKHFSEGHDRRWYKADFAYSGPVQRAGWEADHITFDGDDVELKITREYKDVLPFTGAEYQRRGEYHYGRYEVVMKAARGSGLVSSFFTHTGPSQNGDPHDEIDIEFLGHRTSELHINHFADGDMAGSTYVQLPYDAADVFQLYAFDWLPDEIIWYVAEEEVFRVTSQEHPLPVTPSRLIMNLWTGSQNQYAWHGRPTFKTGATAEYICVSYTVLGDQGAEQCSDTFDADLPPLFGSAE
ncbi:MAG: family 16 glycosylhydrolase [Pseudomonadota bacterium]